MGSSARDEFPVSHYEEFLRYAREKYGDTFWQALPREVSRYYCDKVPVEKRNTRRKVCMIAYTYYSLTIAFAATQRPWRGAEISWMLLHSPWPRKEYAAGRSSDRTQRSKVYNVLRREQNESNPWTYAMRHLRFMLE